MTEEPCAPEATEFMAREVEVAVQTLVDLVERCDKADRTLREAADLESDGPNKDRLTAKAEGVRLARSYIQEALRIPVGPL